MKQTAFSLSALITSIVLLVTGNAFLMTLLGLRLSLDGFNAEVIGWILVFYSIGFVGGTLYAGKIIERVGHIRAFAVFAALLSVAILLHPLAVQAGLWGLLRFLAGFVMAGLMIVVESWISSKADNQNRSSLFAIYQVVFFLSTTGGQVLIRVSDPAGYVPFTLAAILVILALIPLSLTRTESPVIEQGRRMSLRRLYQASSVGATGSLLAGFLISAFYAMGPVYANQMGLEINQISNFMASAIIGAMLLAWPVGKICDRYDRYRVMLAVSLSGGTFSVLAALLGNHNMPLLILCAGLYMGITATLYPIAVAITNDLMDSSKITAAATALLLSYGVGSCIGPVVSSVVMGVLGPRGLFITGALVLGGLSLFMLKKTHEKHTPVSQQEQFITTTPEATLGLQVLDPRNPDFEE
ncbi:MFS transporter [Marinimicrobium sp. C6131]|uniref:MFS transporter n=1 Tax=Marinimicrobium sp. C6131 TaxID=3022676 RepID=UPI00223DFDED|nr:MFS transporter [Marinimicrobium sp. C6131]UZJ44015.1 MFS transporter [Marinimicrobium sp. C6131]